MAAYSHGPLARLISLEGLSIEMIQWHVRIGRTFGLGDTTLALLMLELCCLETGPTGSPTDSVASRRRVMKIVDIN